MDFGSILDIPPFSLKKQEKEALFLSYLSELTRHHYENCPAYRRMLDGLGRADISFKSLDDIPFIPVSLFKRLDLMSITEDKILKTMSSSGTTGQQVSKIYLDSETARNQRKTLSKIICSIIGPKRLPMLIIDSKEQISNRESFSARGAGILGFSIFGRDITYALDENMALDSKRLEAFCEKYQDTEVLIFGFTSIVYQHFIQKALAGDFSIKLPKAYLFHGGGWKKMQDQAVDNLTYKKMAFDALGIKNVHNYYGMVEQTGSIFPECEQGFLHSSIFSDIIIRNVHFQKCDMGEKGLVQLLSLLPHSYPGHSILTEDVGELVGEDDCKCGRAGKYFILHGRAAKAETRGCSDV